MASFAVTRGIATTVISSSAHRRRRWPFVVAAVLTLLIAAFVLVRVRGPYWLSETSSPTWARTLMLLGVDPNADIPGRVSPFERQASEGNHELIRIMLDAGARVDARDKFGTTALFTAVHQGHLQTVQVLVEHGGADVSVIGDCRSPYQLAIEYSRDEIAAYLVSRGARTDPVPCN